MAYNNAIPQPGDRLIDSQGDILNNFIEIKNLIYVDHVTFAGALGQGKHNKVTLPLQAVAPVVGADNMFYNFNFPFTGRNEVYVRSQHFGPLQVDIAMTASSLGAALPVQGDPGWTLMPSGILMSWGRSTVATGPGLGVVHVLPPGLFGTIFAVYPVLEGNVVGSISLVSIDSNAQFTIRTSVNAFHRYLIIGV
jgi:hypothetical protein